jgi:hypothetical protein
VIVVLSQLALAADCASSCTDLLAYLGVTDPAQQQACVQSCTAASGAAPVQAPAQAASQCPDPSAQADQRLYSTLVANNWCGFTFRGSTTTKTYLRLDPSGLATQSTNAETVRTGSNTDMYGNVTQTYGAWNAEDGTQRGCWRLQGAAAQVSSDGQAWYPVALSVVPNSNGAPILTIDGAEYMRCN